jgi:hypothetical protein
MGIEILTSSVGVAVGVCAGVCVSIVVTAATGSTSGTRYAESLTAKEFVSSVTAAIAAWGNVLAATVAVAAVKVRKER